MLQTPPTKTHIAALAAAFWLSVPVFNAAYYIFQRERGAYPTNADSIGIPIITQSIAWLVLTPVFALLAWIVLRNYRGGRSFLAWDTMRPWWCAFVSLFWGGLVVSFLWSMEECLALHNQIDAAGYAPWVYLCLCIRSSAIGAIVPRRLKRRVLLLSVYVEASPYRAVTQIQTQIENKLLSLGATPRFILSEPYWKIPTYHGLTWHLSPTETGTNALTYLFDDLVAFAPVGWTFGGGSDADAAWNQSDAAIFLVPPVRWAHLEYVEVDG